MENVVALDRDALYYPYIHITDVNWLKSTLLCFPNVRRMVPMAYTPNDSDEIKEFCQIEGPRGEALLTSVDLFSEAAMNAEEELLQKLKDNEAFIRRRYSKRKTIKEVKKADLFRIHDEKIIERLYNFLMKGNGDEVLAWWTEAPRSRPTRPPEGHWLAMHPRLGSAILSSKALAIADDLGLDIVTESSDVHHCVVSKDRAEIFPELLGKSTVRRAPSNEDLVDDLAEIVIASNFDVSRLSGKQIADLLKDGHDLRRFKTRLMEVAGTIPAIKNPQERAKRLKAAAAEVIAEWKKYSRSLPRFALEALFDTTEVKWPEVARSLAAGGTAMMAGVGAGVGVALVSYAGLKVWQGYKKKASSPYSYLTRIRKEVNRKQSLLVLPPVH